MKIKSILLSTLACTILLNANLFAEQKDDLQKQEVNVKKASEDLVVMQEKTSEENGFLKNKVILIAGTTGIVALITGSIGGWYFTKLSKDKVIEKKEKIIFDKDKIISDKDINIKKLENKADVVLFEKLSCLEKGKQLQDDYEKKDKAFSEYKRESDLKFEDLKRCCRENGNTESDRRKIFDYLTIKTDNEFALKRASERAKDELESFLRMDGKELENFKADIKKRFGIE